MYLRLAVLLILFFTKVFCSNLNQELLQSISTNNINDVELALKSGVDVKGKSGDAALFKALDKENKDIVMLLLKHGANVHASQSGYLILDTAISRGNKDIVEQLLKYGADLNCFSRIRDRPLDCAIDVDDREIVELLLKYGVNINFPDKAERTYLMKASGPDGEHAEIVELLLKHGANVNASQYGMTALMVAARCGNKDTVELLLKHGANINATDQIGYTALTHATTWGYGHPQRLSWKIVDNKVIEAAQKANEDIVKLLLKNGAHVNADDRQRLKERYGSLELPY